MDGEYELFTKRNRRDSIFRLYPNNSLRPNCLLLDYFTHAEEITTEKFMELKKGINNLKLILTGSHLFNPTYLLALFILAFFTALLGYFMDLAIQIIQNFRFFIVNTDFYVVNLIIWVTFSVSLCMLACFFSSFIDKPADQSEIGEVKAVISGVKILNFFHVKTLLLKFIAVTIAVGGGLTMGKEGAFVHISTILGEKIMRFKSFHFIYQNVTMRNQFLSASASAGFASVFKSSIGAMIFSIETTSTNYIVRNMWRAAFCTLVSMIFIEMFQIIFPTEKVNQTDFPILQINLELLAFAVFGIISGLLGYLLITSSRCLINLKCENRFPMIYPRYRYMFIVSLITSILTFAAPYLEQSDIQIMNDMYENTINKHKWDEIGLGLNLVVYLLIKFFLMILTTSLELPTGVIFPLLAIGAVWGRLYGLVMENFYMTNFAMIYGAVGSAALVSSVTHSMSISIEVFAMTGQIHYLVPMITTVFIAYGTSSIFTISYYDSMLEFKKIPYLPIVQQSSSYSLRAKDILPDEYPFLTVNSSVQDLAEAIFKAHRYIKRIPIVSENGILLSEVSISNAKNYIAECYQGKRDSFNSDKKEILTRFTNYMATCDRSLSTDINQGHFKEKDIQIESTRLSFFLKIPIDFSSLILNADDAPFSVLHTAVFAKLQFLFLMLNLNQLYVTKRGVLIGILTRDLFTNVFKKPIRKKFN